MSNLQGYPWRFFIWKNMDLSIFGETKKHSKYYIGSHWGTEDDGYICSSKNMRDNYRYRPHDFQTTNNYPHLYQQN